MGNNVAPSFLDVMEMNIYYKCRDNCLGASIRCKHGGYPHPRDCHRCICPWGFGGFDCGDLASADNGPTATCGGAVLDAGDQPKTLDGGVSAKSGYGMAERHASCFWHIRAPAGKRVELRLRTLAGACADGCFYGGTELKTQDFLRVGARICCRSDIANLGFLYTESEMAIVGVFSQYKRQSFSLEYRAVDASEVPPGGRKDFPPSPPKSAKKQHTSSLSSDSDSRESRRKNGEKAVAAATNDSVCKDVASNCWSLLNFCEDSNYRELMRQQCAKTCMKCETHVELQTKETGGEGSNKKGGNGAFCGSDHKNCATWAQNGFCESPHYTAQIKREICPQTCKAC